MKSDIHERMHELMNHLNELLDVKVKDEEIRQLYNEYQEKKGASEDRLAAFETEMYVRLPEDFREFYKCKDGSGYAFHILYPGDAEREECPRFT
ncbi:SMI1/KNR4 family protein [Paenibacillus sp. CC-CFT742]|nr:SMI1/KNR4 family protein [Paenibacillus sp. CC-CFT742]WJH28789.1 SMI1/KNR4 family protein [Paenibacillus sp. CC-CFT742]